MIPLKIHNGGSYGLMEFFTCWKCVIFHAVTAFLFVFKKEMYSIKPKMFEQTEAFMSVYAKMFCVVFLFLLKGKHW